MTADLDLVTRLRAHLERTRLLAGARLVVVACSGGGDSTALLAALVPLAAEAGFGLVPAHVAHGLRGDAGIRDARFAADLARDLDLPFSFRSVDVKEFRAKGESLEAAGRRLRYESLLALAGELGAGTLVATGHTRDDQTETTLLNLHRRAGRSRGGIRARRADGVVRPLLPFTRAELRDFLRESGLPWREDETNEDERHLRNRIRRTVLPAIEARWPGASMRLARAAEAWTARLEALDAQVDAALASAEADAKGPFPRALFAGLPSEAAGRLLVRAAGARGRIPGRKQVARVIERLARGDLRFGEMLGGLRLSADPRTVRLSAAPRAVRRPPARLSP